MSVESDVADVLAGAVRLPLVYALKRSEAELLARALKKRGLLAADEVDGPVQ